MTDPIADYLTRIRNAQRAGHRRVDIPASKMKRAITQILHDKGYIQNYLDIDDNKQGLIRVFLKYDHYGTPVIKKLDRVSKPGLRKYCSSQDVPRVLNGYGIAILTTSQGVMTDKEARKLGVGGEIICEIY
ncbi:MAG: 30S ribosomal protein S8 [Candidatus Cyclonatronum sp.]|uniref:30S ribosomal protein S8 n=1 Tax=Cyclonatronum sp. TaxID=3024185 RepID=UPI0025B80B21|nr:30S ribosomal protein S8 [Cyclonatronum sp.]MCC5935005.1 30S ribosomal protein S8 [Balneolales bacterium]MCH8487449.1 30S ribosomal protein S8 [Cyclonatronum sp.]